MTDIAFLNNQFVPLDQARISPMDRGFLFGDGVYEVIPVHHGQAVGFSAHMQRLMKGLSAIGIETGRNIEQWQSLVSQVIEQNYSQSTPYLSVYLHVSRGTDSRRHHSFPKNIQPTIFAYTFEIPPPPVRDRNKVQGFSVGLQQDLRWRRCHIKSTSLLGNVLHYQNGADKGWSETILYNQHNQVTEASACNVFIVSDGMVKTPPLDEQLLPGITRQLVLKGLRENTDLNVDEQFFTVDDLLAADEVWITSSTKEIGPVFQVEGKTIGDGKPGLVWERAIEALNQVKFE